MVRRKCKKRFSEGEEDPMAGTSNLVDAMLVIAVGLLIFVVISMNMQSVVFQDNSHDQSQAVQQSFSNTKCTKSEISGALYKSEDQKPMTTCAHLSRFYNEFRKISICQDRS